MCKELCENPDFGTQSCQDCGKLICFDTVHGDDLFRPAFVTSSGDLFCDRCGRQNEDREDAEGYDDYDPYSDFQEYDEPAPNPRESEPMPLYRKKPIVIEASQWWPPGDPRHHPKHRVGCEVGMADIGTITVIRPDAHSLHYSMKTISGWVRLDPGDWIITGPTTEKTSRDLYPCKPDVFAATYEPAPEPNGEK